MNQSLPVTSVKQSAVSEPCPVLTAVRKLSDASVEGRGAIFTRREVADFILDLVGYTADRPLHDLKLLEPSFGDGDFLIPAIERLLEAWKNAGQPNPLLSLAHSIRAIELHRVTFITTRQRIISLLTNEGFDQKITHSLVEKWLLHADFLLAEFEGNFDVIVGNPPYIRQELIPDVLMTEYRSRYRTIYDRADIYIPFVERSLMSLAKGGSLGFICADRWMKNRYGGPLRHLVASKFHLKIYVDMVDTSAFHSNVIAYPAITVISREKPGPTRIAYRPAVDRENFLCLSKLLRSEKLPIPCEAVREVSNVTADSEPWIFDSSNQLSLVRKLEKYLPTIEEAGCKVGIGVATGSDQAFIAPYDELDIEPDRKVPIVMTRDIVEGVVNWRGYAVVNPFSPDGELVNLDDYPRLKRYFEKRKEIVAKRHVARKSPVNWYRTIDRIYPDLTDKKKLLIPDIKGDAHIVYEEGKLYPHHNLYFITSDTWDLRALQAVLLSGIARLFISTYSTKMRGGYLRFQAQYLRRIRVPYWADVPSKIREELINAAKLGDIAACNNAVYALYNLTKKDQVVLERNEN